MLKRKCSHHILEASETFPIVAITGPRQSGKTTLCRQIFDDRPYVSFENPDTAERFEADPRGFLKTYRDGAVFDEAQKCPTLFSYLQGVVDEAPAIWRFVLTGSSQFHLFAGITQSLAGRIVTLELLPFCLQELLDGGLNLSQTDLDDVMLRGMYPPIHDRNPDPTLWYANYVRNYVERDVRALINVKDLSVFQRFLRLCAGRTGQLLNMNEIGNEAGVSHNTIKSWLSVLEASYIVFLLRPFHSNYSKRLVKTSKLYFYDTGLLCWLLSIREKTLLDIHPMRGNIFESFIMSEVLKTRYNRLQANNLYFWRDRSGNEIDLIVDHGIDSTPIEIKSTATFQQKHCHQIKRWESISGSGRQPVVLYGGDERFEHSGCVIRPWNEVGDV